MMLNAHTNTQQATTYKSRDIDYTTVESAPIAHYGILCRRNAQGGYLTNLDTDFQDIEWGHASEKTTLFGQIILNQMHAIGLAFIPISPLLLAQFVEDILETMPAQGGRIPLSELELWLHNNSYLVKCA